MHVIAGAGTRILLSRLVPGLNIGIAFLLAFVAAMALPVVAEALAERMRVSTLLGLRPLPFWRPEPKAVSA